MLCKKEHWRFFFESQSTDNKTFDKAQRKDQFLNTLQIEIEVEVMAKAAEAKSNSKYG